MPDVADYRVISDNPVTVQTGGDIDKEFTFDLGTAVQHSQNSVLQFFMVSGANANNLSFECAINGNPIRTINVNGNHFASIHEVARNVTQDNTNRLKLRITGGSGSVKVSDIVLWVQRQV